MPKEFTSPTYVNAQGQTVSNPLYEARRAPGWSSGSTLNGTVTNINRALEDLKERGFWIYGLDERGENDYDRVDYGSPTVIVLGGEGKGLHEQVRKHCDMLVRIPMAGKISSLNVSVAAGVVLFEWKRRRSKQDSKL